MEEDLLFEVLEGRNLSAKELHSLEDRIIENSSDTSARAKLLGYYFITQYQSKKNQKNYFKHVLWFIGNTPGWRISGSQFVRIPKIALAKTIDEYRVAEEVWNNHLAIASDNTAILNNAANFFINNDTSISIKLYKTAIQREPGRSLWHDKLAHVYSLYSDDKKHKELAYREQLTALELYEKDDKSYQLELVAERAFKAGHYKEAENYAIRLLDQIDNCWLKDSCLHTAHTVLGLVSIAKGDEKKAVKHLVSSSQTKGNPRPGGPTFELANQILKSGHTESVKEYLEYCKCYSKNDSVDKWIKEIERGKLPNLSHE